MLGRQAHTRDLVLGAEDRKQPRVREQTHPDGSQGSIDVSVERTYRDHTIVVLIAEPGLRGAELFCDMNEGIQNGPQGDDVDVEMSRSLQQVLGSTAVGFTEAAQNVPKRVQELSTDGLFPTEHAALKYAVAAPPKMGGEPAAAIQTVTYTWSSIPTNFTEIRLSQLISSANTTTVMSPIRFGNSFGRTCKR